MRQKDLTKPAAALLRRLGEKGEPFALRIEADRLHLISLRDPSHSLRSMPKSVAHGLLAAGLVVIAASGSGKILRLTAKGEERARRLAGDRVQAEEKAPGKVTPFRAQHGGIGERRVTGAAGVETVAFNENESPLLWMRRRKGRDGKPLIGDAAFAASERLRSDYTIGTMAPRMSADWSNPMAGRPSGGAGLNATDSMIAARQRFNAALAAVGPEFSGVLFDLCCFLKGLEQIERERSWPARSAKVVAGLALQRLARHYGYDDEARGRERGTTRSWSRSACQPPSP